MSDLLTHEEYIAIEKSLNFPTNAFINGQFKSSKSGKTFVIVGIGINLIKSPSIKGYLTTNLFDLTGVKITPNNAALKLKKIYETFIPMFPKFNIKNLDRNLK